MTNPRHLHNPRTWSAPINPQIAQRVDDALEADQGKKITSS